MLALIWRGIGASYKSRYRMTIWQQFEDQIRSAAYTSNLSKFVSSLCFKLNADIGTNAEHDAIVGITQAVKGAVNLCGQTGISEIAELGRHAALCLGNDTGPMHILALGSKPTIVLFSSYSDPKLCAPRGKKVHVMQEEELPDLKEKEVISMIKEALKLDSK